MSSVSEVCDCVTRLSADAGLTCSGKTFPKQLWQTTPHASKEAVAAMVEGYLTSAGSAQTAGVQYEKENVKDGGAVFTIQHADMRLWLHGLNVSDARFAPV